MKTCKNLVQELRLPRFQRVEQKGTMWALTKRFGIDLPEATAETIYVVTSLS